MIRFSILCFLSLICISIGWPSADNTCSRRGRLLNPVDCGSYYECLEDKYARSLVPFSRSCPGGAAFNPLTSRCGKSTEVKGCNVRRGRHFDSNPKYDYLCKNGSVSFACADCQTQITCTEGRAYVTKCESNLRCLTDSPDFEGGVCHTHFDDQCRCTEPNSYRQDPFSNSTFFMCESENAVPTYYNCQQGMYFDETSKTCVNNDGSPACTSSGLFMFPENCSKFYMCTFALEGWVQTKMTCPDQQLFNQKTERCEDPCTWEQKDFKCEIQGRFQNPRDCRKFTECIDDSNGGLLAMERRCPPGFHWNDQEKKCIVRILSSCKDHSEGPLKNCRKDYISICQAKPETLPAVISTVNEKPENVPVVEVQPNPVFPLILEIDEQPAAVPVVEQVPAVVIPEIEQTPELIPEEKPLAEIPVEEKPVEVKPVEVKPEEENPIETKPEEETQSDKNLVAEIPKEAKPVDSKPTDITSVEVNENVIEDKPEENKPDITVVEEKPDIAPEAEIAAVPQETEETENANPAGDANPEVVTVVEITPEEEKAPVEEKAPEEAPVIVDPLKLPQIEELSQGKQTLPETPPDSQEPSTVKPQENNIIPVQVIGGGGA